MDGTIIGQGSFLSQFNGTNPNPGVASIVAANPMPIQIPSGADWVHVRNFTEYSANGSSAAFFNGTGNAFIGIDFYWQRNTIAQQVGEGIVMYKSNGASTLNADVLLSGAFTLLDASGQDTQALPLIGNSVATTATTNATQPVVSTGNTAGLQPGSIVVMSNTAQTDVNGIPMVVSAVTTNTNFTLLFASNALANAPGAIGGAGFYRILNYDPLFYPRNRYVTNVTKASNGVVSTSIPHQYVAGQSIRFNIPTVSGMIQLNSTGQNNYRTATVVTVIDSYSFTIDIDTTSFTTFTWPTIAQQPSSFPEVTPVGENSALALASTQPQTPIDIFGNQINATNTGFLSDSTVNTAFYGMLLGSGGNGNALGTPIIGPAGTVSFNSSDAISQRSTVIWVAGKSTYGGL